MRERRVNVNHLAYVAVSRLKGELVKEGREPSSPAFRNSLGRLTEKKAMDIFCVDLITRASNGSIDPVIGRDTEVQRIIQILCRRTKSNPILLGEAGVGKTAIAEGLATSIADENVPSFLMVLFLFRNEKCFRLLCPDQVIRESNAEVCYEHLFLFARKKRILSLDVGLLIAGTKERGELEGRVTMLIKEIKKSGNIILFIDEVHTLIGERGSKGSGLDIANLLKPALGRGEFQCMASTTMDEFRLHFEKDKALARRFQPVLINEPSKEDAVQILLGLCEKYEAHHKCVYTLEAINAAVHLSARYIPDRYLPDKAIDLMDEAGSRARMEASKTNKEKQVSVLSSSPSDYWKEIRAVQAMHKASPVTKLTENDDTSRMEENGKHNSSPSLAPSISDNEASSRISVVGHEDIASVASLWSGIPVNNLTDDERMLLLGLDEQLKKRVIGQDEAVSAICRAVKRSRIGLKDPDRPIAAMLFCGPTGVGKTELTKALAATYFGSESAMLRLDMSEYMERHTVSKIIGSPPGYVGYKEGGTLTEAIRRRPFTVVLLDEIEKAHPDIFNILLQLFEDGHLTDSQGRLVSFKNAPVVMTSNVGSAAIAKGRQNGFGFFTARDDSTSYASGMQTLVMEELKRYFRPELLNRIDEIVVFRPLEKPQMLEIPSIMLHEVKERLIPLGIGLEVSEAIIDLICQQGYDRSYGARPLRRAVTRFIEDLVSESLLSGEYKSGDIAVIHLDDSGNPVVTNKSKQGIQLSDTNPELHGLNPTV
ncbi:hypothetical protein OROGR_029075 [Orobanche gracilis]